MGLDSDEYAAARTLEELRTEVVAVSRQAEALCEGMKSGFSPCESQDDIMREIQEFEAAVAAHDAESERRLSAAKAAGDAEERRAARERTAILRELRASGRPGLAAIASVRAEAERWGSQLREWREELRAHGDSVRRLLSGALRPGRSRRRFT